MKTSTAIVIGVVGLAAVGGIVYFATRKRPAARPPAAPGASFLQTVNTAIPLVSKITSYFGSSHSSGETTSYSVDQHDADVLDSQTGVAFSDG
jgi:hypothetical protein